MRQSVTDREEHIPGLDILVFSSPVMGVFMAGMLLNFYLLKFSTDVLLIAPAVVGTVLLVARIWDAVTDPAVGWLSDRTRTPLGRRRPWFLASAIPLGGSIVMLWSPPSALSGTALTLWVGGAVLLFYTAYTAFRVPHIAMAAELSRGYHDRTRVFGIMQAVESIGMLAAAAAVVLLEQAEDPRAVARLLALAIGGFATVLILIVVWRLRERAEFQGRGGTNPWQSFRDVIANPHARNLIGVFFLEQLGFATLLALIPYLSDYVLNTPGSTGLYLFGAIGASLLSIPLWIRLSAKFGKRKVWLFAMTIKTGLLALIFFLGSGDFVPMLMLTMVFGLMNGCGAIVGPSLKADVIDWDEAETGERKEGAYFAAWDFVQKSAGGVSVWIIGVVLSMTGFVPNAVQGEHTITGIMLLASAAPCVAHLLALGIMAQFSLNENEHLSAIRKAAQRSA